MKLSGERLAVYLDKTAFDDSLANARLYQWPDVCRRHQRSLLQYGFWYAAGVVMNGGSITNCIVVDNWSVFGGAVSNIYNEA